VVVGPTDRGRPRAHDALPSTQDGPRLSSRTAQKPATDAAANHDENSSTADWTCRTTALCMDAPTLSITVENQGVEAISSCRRPTDRSRCDSELHRCCITTSCITHVRTVNTADRRSAASLPREGDARMGIAWPASPAAAAWVEVMSSPRYVTPHETSRRCALTPDQPAAVNGLCYHQRCSGWPRACGAATVALVVIDVSRPAMKLAVARAVGR